MSNRIGEHVRAVVVDHDDTLVGTIAPKWQAHKHIAKTHYGKELTDDELRSLWGTPLRQMVGLLYGDEDLDRAMAHEQATHDLFPKLLFDRTTETIQRLHELGLKLGVVTAASRVSLEYDFRTLGIPGELFDHQQTQEDTDFHKPDWRVFEPTIEWLAEHGIDPSETLYVGDGLHDMKASLDAGFGFIGVETGLVTAEQFKEAGATSLPTIADLIN